MDLADLADHRPAVGPVGPVDPGGPEGPGVAADPVDPVDPLKAGGAADPLRAAGPAVARPAEEVAGRGVRQALGVVAGPAVAQVRREVGEAAGRARLAAGRARWGTDGVARQAARQAAHQAAHQAARQAARPAARQAARQVARQAALQDGVVGQVRRAVGRAHAAPPSGLCPASWVEGHASMARRAEAGRCRGSQRRRHFPAELASEEAVLH